MSNRRLYQLDHCTYQCDYHLVWTTRYRGKVMADTYIKQLLAITFKRICRWKGFRPWAWHAGGVADGGAAPGELGSRAARQGPRRPRLAECRAGARSAGGGSFLPRLAGGK